MEAGSAHNIICSYNFDVFGISMLCLAWSGSDTYVYLFVGIVREKKRVIRCFATVFANVGVISKAYHANKENTAAVAASWDGIDDRHAACVHLHLLKTNVILQSASAHGAQNHAHTGGAGTRP